LAPAPGSSAIRSTSGRQPSGRQRWSTARGVAPLALLTTLRACHGPGPAATGAGRSRTAASSESYLASERPFWSRTGHIGFLRQLLKRPASELARPETANSPPRRARRPCAGTTVVLGNVSRSASSTSATAPAGPGSDSAARRPTNTELEVPTGHRPVGTRTAPRRLARATGRCRSPARKRWVSPSADMHPANVVTAGGTLVGIIDYALGEPRDGSGRRGRSVLGERADRGQAQAGPVRGAPRGRVGGWWLPAVFARA
jgi:hypothetical protein